MAKSLQFQDGVGAGSSTVFPLHLDDVKNGGAGLSIRRVRFVKSKLVTRAAAFASVLAIVMLISVCSTQKTRASISGIPRRALSGDEDATPAKRSKLCVITEAESDASTFPAPLRRSSQVEPSDPVAQSTEAYPGTSQGTGILQRLASEPASSTSSGSAPASAARSFSVIRYAPSRTADALREPSRPHSSGAQDVIEASSTLESMRQQAAQQSTREVRGLGAVLQSGVGLYGHQQAPPPGTAIRRPLEALLLAAQSVEQERSTSQKSGEPCTSFAPALEFPLVALSSRPHRKTSSRTVQSAHFDPSRAMSFAVKEKQLLKAYENVQFLLIKGALDESQQEDLGFWTEELMAHILQRKVSDISDTLPYATVCELARRFLLLDTLVHSLTVLRVPREYWWLQVIAKFPNDCSVISVFDDRDKLDRFYRELGGKLLGALDILKTGVRPSNDEIDCIKTMLFCSNNAPYGIKSTRWNTLRTFEKGA